MRTRTRPFDVSELDLAIEVFAKAIAFCRSFTCPSEALQIDGLWVIRDVERKNPRDYRREEWVGWHASAREVNAIARSHTRGRFCVCAIRATDEPDQPLRDDYRAAGYRLGSTEAIMAHPLKPIQKYPQPVPVVRVKTKELADRVARGAGRKQILPAQIESDVPLRLYAALDDEKPIGWVRSITIGNSTWVSNVYVTPNYRRKGVGSSLMEKMMRDDLAFGSKRSVLTASHAGEWLYQSLGYNTVGQLFLYTPNRK